MIDSLTNVTSCFKNIYFILHIIAIYLSYIAFFVAFLAALLYLIQDRNLKSKRLGVIFGRLPDLSLLDRLNYKSIGLGFPILTLAIISGSFWAKDIWGSYWNWNPREVYALVLWLLYAVILHVRLSFKLRGKKVAVLSILAFFIMSFTLFSRCGVIK
jgi:ABC-type transport system involved in cytochrome c biogenesis permease subunit